jgi:hypothetical protein
VGTAVGLWDFAAYNQCASSFRENRTNAQLRQAGWSKDKIAHFRSRPTNAVRIARGDDPDEVATIRPTDHLKRKMGVDEAVIALYHPTDAYRREKRLTIPTRTTLTILRAHNREEKPPLSVSERDILVHKITTIVTKNLHKPAKLINQELLEACVSPSILVTHRQLITLFLLVTRIEWVLVMLQWLFRS